VAATALARPWECRFALDTLPGLAMMGMASPATYRRPSPTGDGPNTENFLMTRLICCAALFGLVSSQLGCQTGTGPTTPAAPAIVAGVKATDLMQEYANNAVAADAKYKGKPLRVSGKFASASKVPLMGYAVTVVPEDADLNFSGVQCFIVESAEADVGKYQPGQMISLQGTCDGQSVGQVKMSKCTVVK
jgi:hypothetical protein